MVRPPNPDFDVWSRGVRTDVSTMSVCPCSFRTGSGTAGDLLVGGTPQQSEFDVRSRNVRVFLMYLKRYAPPDGDMWVGGVFRAQMPT